jgi:Protein of unknown function (DUF1360)
MGNASIRRLDTVATKEHVRVTGLKKWAHDVTVAYSAGHDRPLGGYLGALGTYGAMVATAAGIGKLTGRQIQRPETRDLVLISLATYKFSRTLAKDPIASPLRAPFVTYTGTSGEAELAEEVRGTGAQHAVGELVSCPFCLAQWVATAFVAGMVLAPRWTRLATSVFAAKAASDFLQFGYDAAQKTTSGL